MFNVIRTIGTADNPTQSEQVVITADLDACYRSRQALQAESLNQGFRMYQVRYAVRPVQFATV